MVGLCPAVPRSLVATVGLAIAGSLIADSHISWPPILCGVLKILYNIALLWIFRPVSSLE